MVSVRWREKRRPYWERLEQLVHRAGRSLSVLDNRELQELGLLYRQTASDLSVVLEDKTSVQLAAYLNQLLGRSHNLLYMGRSPKASGIWTFYSQTYPRLFRETWRPTLLATVVFAAGAIAGWVVTIHDPGFAHRILGPEMMDTIARREMWTHSVVAMKPVAASGITTNNLTVSFTIFALGITAIGTLWMLVFNGVLLGVVGAATWHAGMALALWSFVAPHGVLELPAIFIAGGGGLEIARGLFFPGTLPRRESLALAGGRAARLLLGSIPMLLVAGAIEGFFSATNSPLIMKFSLAAVLFALLLMWLLPSRRPAATTDSGL
jgi:uncharacterized membrane protein SpoIIM required for sporulation